MQQSDQPNIFTRLWVSSPASITRWMTALVLVFVAPVANAQSFSFNDLGVEMLQSVCLFIKSPIVTVIVAASFIAVLVVAALNEDKGTLSKVLKIVAFGLAIVMLPGVMQMVGFKGMAC